MQKTLKKSVTLNGIGLHSGVNVRLELHPAPAHHGVVFERTDMETGKNIIPATWDKVVDTRLCTVIANEHGARVSTIEHVMAALRGLGIDNALVKIDGAEVPILDGSSVAFVKAIEEAGIEAQSAPRRAIKILKEVVYQDGARQSRLSPSAIPTYKGRIDYDNPSIGSQEYALTLVNGNFKHDLADCRTFCLKSDVDMMQANGLALGGSLDNAVVVDDNGIMNAEGLRCHNEFIRHKLLDAIGDLALAGGLVLGQYEGFRAGHEMNNKLLHALFADDTAYEIIDLYVEIDEDSAFSYGKAPVSVATSLKH